jgi:hypothetical protein
MLVLLCTVHSCNEFYVKRQDKAVASSTYAYKHLFLVIDVHLGLLYVRQIFPGHGYANAPGWYPFRYFDLTRHSGFGGFNYGIIDIFEQLFFEVSIAFVELHFQLLRFSFV